MRRAAPLLLAGALASALPAQDVRRDAHALAVAQSASAAARARADALDRRSTAAASAAERARDAQAAVAARIEAAEAGIDAATARIAGIEALRREQRARLAAKQGAIVRLTAAVQSMARRPAGLALVEPGSIDDAVHLRGLLAAAVPLVRARTAGLRAEVAEGNRLRAAADRAVAELRGQQAELSRQRTELARVELSERARSVGLSRAALDETERAEGLGEQARDLIDAVRDDTTAAGTGLRLMRLAGPIERPLLPGERREPPAPGGAPLYRLPLAGEVVTGFGEVSPSGVRARGLTLAADAAAPVSAPLAGTIAYAGPFRRYGRIVIIDHGSGWSTLVTGLGTTAVAVGDHVVAGARLGVAGSRGQVAVELRRHGRPVDLSPLLFARRG